MQQSFGYHFLVAGTVLSLKEMHRGRAPAVVDDYGAGSWNCGKTPARFARSAIDFGSPTPVLSRR